MALQALDDDDEEIRFRAIQVLDKYPGETQIAPCCGTAATTRTASRTRRSRRWGPCSRQRQLERRGAAAAVRLQPQGALARLAHHRDPGAAQDRRVLPAHLPDDLRAGQGPGGGRAAGARARVHPRVPGPRALGRSGREGAGGLDRGDDPRARGRAPLHPVPLGRGLVAARPRRAGPGRDQATTSRCRTCSRCCRTPSPASRRRPRSASGERPRRCPGCSRPTSRPDRRRSCGWRSWTRSRRSRTRAFRRSWPASRRWTRTRSSRRRRPASASQRSGKADGGDARAARVFQPHDFAANPQPTLNDLLRHARAVNASDLHVSTGTVPQLRLYGRLGPLPHAAGDARAGQGVARPAAGTDGRRQRLEERRQLDFCHKDAELGRFRTNLFHQRKGLAAVFRLVPYEIPNLTDIGLPESLWEITTYSQGLILVTGPAGCGKTTTLAALVDRINETAARPHPDGRGPDRVRPHEQGVAGQPARGPGALALVREGAAAVAARGPGRHPGRRDARPRDDLARDHGLRDGPPRARDPAHDDGVLDGRPHHQRVPAGPAGPDPHDGLGLAEGGHLADAPAPPRRPGARGGLRDPAQHPERRRADPRREDVPDPDGDPDGRRPRACC